MSNHRGFTFSALMLAMIVMAASGALAADRTLDAGTVLPVKLDDTLSSKDSRRGDRFVAVVQSDRDYYRDTLHGAIVEGVVTEARPHRNDDPGVLDLDFQTLETADGRRYNIDGSLIGLDIKSVSRTSDGRLVARGSSSSNKTKYIGYGAGAGLLVAILTGHSTSETLRDVVIGAGLGYLYGNQSSKSTHDVVLKNGTEFGVRLDRRITVADTGYYDRYDPRYDDYRNDDTRYDYRYDEDYRSDNSRYDYNRPRLGQYGRDRRSSDILVIVNGQEVRFTSSAKPRLEGDILMVPAVDVLRAARVRYDLSNRDEVLMARGSQGQIRATVGSDYATEGSRRHRMDAKVRKYGNVLYVPMDFVEIVTGRDWQWDSRSRTAVLFDRGEDWNDYQRIIRR